MPIENYNQQSRSSSLWTSFIDDSNWPSEASLMNWSDTVNSTGIDMYETDKEVVVEAQIPGIPEDKLSIEIEENVLSIFGNLVESDKEKDKKKIIYKNTRQTMFCYITILPHLVDESKAKATVEFGVVKVEIPKSETEKINKIA
ncbi:MAG TPA: Hsp20/alpha crystallin family protein [Candidatus Saccharimonadales bacterium]|nr:Hsp20/alpha crystallin family protein [Candidatus Saccharimonadales bacterium]